MSSWRAACAASWTAPVLTRAAQLPATPESNGTASVFQISSLMRSMRQACSSSADDLDHDRVGAGALVEDRRADD